MSAGTKTGYSQPGPSEVDYIKILFKQYALVCYKWPRHVLQVDIRKLSRGISFILQHNEIVKENIFNMFYKVKPS